MDSHYDAKVTNVEYCYLVKYKYQYPPPRQVPNNNPQINNQLTHAKSQSTFSRWMDYCIKKACTAKNILANFLIFGFGSQPSSPRHQLRQTLDTNQ